MRNALAILLTFAAVVVALVAGVYLSFFGSRTIVLAALAGALVLIVVSKLWQSWRLWLRNLGAGIALTAVALIGLELLLALIGSRMISRADIESLTIRDFNCNEPQGCHFDPAKVAELNALRDPNSIDPDSRSIFVNAQGFHDADDFAPDALPEDAYRILVSGDSFTVGFTAEIGRSYIETLEKNVPNVVAWNVGFPGTSMHHILTSLSTYAPIMQPDLLLVGINQNDFTGNLFPIDQFLAIDGTDASPTRWVEQYALDRVLQPVKLDDTQVRYRYFEIDGVALTPLNQSLFNTRIGYRLYSILKRFPPERDGIGGEAYHQFTQVLMGEKLVELRVLADALGVPLLTVAVPAEAEIDEAMGSSYARMLELLTEAGIPYLDPLPILTHDDYRNANPSDPHWNTAGHEKVGAMVTGCVAYMIENDGEMCPTAVAPS